MKKINCFIPSTELPQLLKTISTLKETGNVNKIFILSTNDYSESISGVDVIKIDNLQSTNTIQLISNKSDADYTLIYTKSTSLQLGLFALDRMISIMNDADAGMVYADHYKMVNETLQSAPVIDYQKGSLRDDFDFGSVLFYNSSYLRECVSKMTDEYKYAGMYDLRLKMSQYHSLIHINEYLYTDIENDLRKSGEKIFDYVNPKNREVQVEMEKACINHIKNVDAYLAPVFKNIEFSSCQFTNEASVIIPVRNRIRTIKDAIKSALNQKTSFKFNVIIVDNHSTDGTTQAIDEFKSDERVIHIVPQRNDLGIGGCWNVAINHPQCGKFAIQLDSDDVYKDEKTLTTMVEAFYKQNCAMVVGTYMMTDLNMKMIEPGIIDHKEWSPENGRNNALRINGLGAPRGFYTPVLRDIKVPNTSYGEDYALGLNISRNYQIGRIYDVLYLCRRWDDNSDASLDINKTNQHNLYKDRIRTWEVEARIIMNKSRK